MSLQYKIMECLIMDVKTDSYNIHKHHINDVKWTNYPKQNGTEQPWVFKDCHLPR